MKILVIGDPHGYNQYKRSIFRGVDLILCIGDLGKADFARKRHFENVKRKMEGLPELEEDSAHVRNVHTEIHNSTISVLKKLSIHCSVYTLQGNVGIPNRKKIREEKEKYGLKLPCTKDIIDKMKNVYLTKNVIRNRGGLRFGFLEHFLDNNWIKEFNSKDKKRIKSAKRDTQKAKRILNRFGYVDILVSHQPPYGYLDEVSGKFGAPKQWWGKHAGSKILLDYIKKHQPRYVFCGHIHEGKGKAKIGKTQVYNVGFHGDYLIIHI